MATTLTDLQSYRDGLIKALGTGTLSVSAGGVSRSFRSVAELQQAISTIDAEMRKVSRGSTRISTIRVASDKGW